MASHSSSQSASPGRFGSWESAALWLALLFAASRILLDLSEHWIAAPWSRYSLVFVPLLVLAIRNTGPGKPSRRAGALLIVVSMLGVLVAVLASVAFVARPFIAVALIGVLLLRGVAHRRATLLALWIVPFPASFMRAMGGLTTGAELFAVAGWLLSPFGVEVATEGRFVHVGELFFAVDPHQGGLVVLAHLVGLAWYWTAVQARTLRDSLKWFAGAALLALPVQVAADVAALALMQLDVAPQTSLRVADFARWAVPTAALALVAWRSRHPASRL